MKKFIKLSILSLSFLTIMTSSAISPSLAKFRNAFPMSDDFVIKLILTLPSLVLIPFSIISGKLAHTIPKRKLLILGLLVYFIGGVGGGFSFNIYMLLFFRIIIGMGVGIILPFSRSLIADFYDGDERIRMMGLSNAVANFGAIVATILSGFLANISWRIVFSVYIISIPIIIIVFFGLPEPKISVNNERSKYINKKVIYLGFLGIFLNIAFYSVMTNISFFIESEKIGTSSTSGIAISSLTFAGFLSGILLQKICSIFKNFKVSVTIFIMGLGFFFLSIANNISLVLIGTFFIGFGMGFIKPLLFLKVIDVTPKFYNSFSLSIVSSSIYLGKFLSPLFFNLLTSIFNNYNYRFIYSVVYISLITSSIISLIINLIPVKTLLKYNKQN